MYRNPKPAQFALLRLDILELLWLVHEVVCICFRCESAVVRLLDKVFVALLLCKQNGILLRLEVEVGSLHRVR